MGASPPAPVLGTPTEELPDEVVLPVEPVVPVVSIVPDELPAPVVTPVPVPPVPVVPVVWALAMPAALESASADTIANEVSIFFIVLVILG